MVLPALAGGIIGMEVTGVCACDWPSPLEIAKTLTEWLAARSRDVPVRDQLVTGWQCAGGGDICGTTPNSPMLYQLCSLLDRPSVWRQVRVDSTQLGGPRQAQLSPRAETD